MALDPRRFANATESITTAGYKPGLIFTDTSGRLNNAGRIRSQAVMRRMFEGGETYG